MEKILSLYKDFSTTRRVIKSDPRKIQNLIQSKQKPEDKFETKLFLPQGEGRQGEGGLRTKGFFKIGGVTPDLDGDFLEWIEEDGIRRKAKPLITIITVVYNGEKFLEETIKSVINQIYDNVEYIIIDGGSTDGTLDIIRKYEHAIDYWVSERDMGISDAFNKGVILATGKLLAILNADDYYFDSNVIGRTSLMVDPKGLEIIYGKTKKKTLDGMVRDKKDSKISWRMSIPFSHCSCFVSLAVYKRVGLYSKNYKIAMDGEFLLRAKQICVIKKIDEIIGVQREGGISDVHRYMGCREYIKAAFPECSIICYFFLALKLILTFMSKKINSERLFQKFGFLL